MGIGPVFLPPGCGALPVPWNILAESYAVSAAARLRRFGSFLPRQPPRPLWALPAHRFLFRSGSRRSGRWNCLIWESCLTAKLGPVSPFSLPSTFIGDCSQPDRRISAARRSVITSWALAVTALGFFSMQRRIIPLRLTESPDCKRSAVPPHPPDWASAIGNGVISPQKAHARLPISHTWHPPKE